MIAIYSDPLTLDELSEHYTPLARIDDMSEKIVT